MLLTRDETATAVDLPTERVPVPELKAGGELLIQGLSGRDRDKFEADSMGGKGRNREVNMRNIRARLLVRTLINEDRTMMFGDRDQEFVGRWRGDVVDRLFSVAQTLSGMSQEDIDALGEASTTQGAGSDSPSA